MADESGFGGGMGFGQFRANLNMNRNKPKQYDFPADADTDTLRNEIDEFFSYVEAPQVAENRAAWEEWCDQHRDRGASARGARAASEGRAQADAAASQLRGLSLDDEAGPSRPREKYEWTSLPTSTRRGRIETLLTSLEVKDPDARIRASRALTYLLQGSFADTKGPDHQLQWIQENARMVRVAGGLSEVFGACKIACWKHDYLSALPDHLDASDQPEQPEGEEPTPLLAPRIKAEWLEEINLELTLYFAQLYILVETGREEEDWSDELMSLEPPLPIFLFNLLAMLREKPAKGYPVKKLLLLLWKSLLACLGGMSDVNRCKKLARELEGLGPVAEAKKTDIKTTPLDFTSFQHDMEAKFPTFNPSTVAPGGVPLDKLASAVNPIPPRKAYRSNTGVDMPRGEGFDATPAPSPHNATPAPTPPQSPKPNKQKYQTDQTRPFVFPYTVSVQGGRMVPFSIEEAGRLYKNHMHISLELWQMWKLRNQCISEERGVADGENNAPPFDFGSGPSSSLFHSLQQRDDPLANSLLLNGTTGFGASSIAGESDSQAGSTSQGSNGLGDVRLRGRGEPTLALLQTIEGELDAEIKKMEGDHTMAVLDHDRYVKMTQKMIETRADVQRLQRVDQLYWAVMPGLQSSVIVLLKLLLATVTAQTSTNSPHARAVAEGVAPDEAPPPTLEDIDIARHREITSKAISAIIVLCLKWFKASHAMKFHYLSQLLVDSNCLLLILKMFGLQEVANSVRSINEAEQFNFFQYCETFCGQNPRQPQLEDSEVLRPSRHNHPMGGNLSDQLSVANGGDDEGTEMVSDFSWRNFFSSINFTRTLQKLTKRRVHRILLLVQYKSSAILKRTLKVNHPELQLYALKVIKSQVPFCGRKWRQSNMKVITAIYLNCRPDLRDEWLAGADVDADVDVSLPQEQALRALLKFYNASRSGALTGSKSAAASAAAAAAAADADANGSAGNNEDAQDPEGQPPPPQSPTQSRNVNFFDSDVLPPIRRSAESTAGTLRYIPDDVVEGYLDNYEDVLGEVFGNNTGDEEGRNGWSSGKWGLTQQGSETAWARLGEILGENESISDSESIVTIGDLGTAGELGEPARDENRAQWEQLSPKEMKFLASSGGGGVGIVEPGSPLAERHALPRRQSSQGSGSNSGSRPSSRSNSQSSPLRPVLPFGLDDLAADDAIALADEPELDLPQPLAQPKEGGIDEVEHIFGT